MVAHDNGAYVQLQESLDALERTYWCLRDTVERKPVRDMAETFAEAQSVLMAHGRMEEANAR